MDIVEQLASACEIWLEKYPNRSLPLLSKITKVDYYALRRIIRREAKNAKFSIAMAIAQVVYDEQERLSFFQTFFSSTLPLTQ